MENYIKAIANRVKTNNEAKIEYDFDLLDSIEKKLKGVKLSINANFETKCITIKTI